MQDAGTGSVVGVKIGLGRNSESMCMRIATLPCVRSLVLAARKRLAG